MSAAPDSPADVDIRPYAPEDADAVWSIFHRVVSAGETYAYDPDTTREEALARWTGAPARCYVAESEGRIVGSYTLKPNQIGLGSHVSNAGFMVDPDAGGRGTGRAMCEHAIDEARALGFRAMQFNLVVATNERAVALWRRLGFEVVGRLPGAFWLRKERYVDALVMYRELTADS
jgi:ribosomal protein S18 acetylase RimI-like enzyme